MLAFLPIQFERPWWLLLLLLIPLLFLIGRRSIGGLSRTKATVAFTARVIVVLLVAAALAQPIWEKRGKGLTVTVLLDRSQSVPLPLQRSSLDYLRKSVSNKYRTTEDRVAVITIARDANIAAMPDINSNVTIGDDVVDRTATNLAAGVKMALAIMPDDTANRIVLASDGNETDDSVLEAAEIARANDVPVDVLVLEYRHDNEVIFDRMVAPARARLGQSANLKLVLRSQAQADGTVFLKMNGDFLDLNGEGSGEGLPVSLEPGLNTIPVTISLDSPGPQEFEALFEPDDLSIDMIDRNNTAVAVTFVGGEGKVLVVDDAGVGGGDTDSSHLVRALRESDITVDVRSPGEIGGLVFLSGYDALILANIPRWALDDQQVRDLHAYAHDLGGGFVMLGGQWSFGAGGWIDTEVARILPIKLDPPSSRQMPRGALAIIMHSCEMPQGNYWGQKVAESAIEALSRLDYVGIVEYNWNAAAGAGQGFGGCSWALPMQEAGDKTTALAATKKMVVGDMPDFASSMRLALSGLTGVRAGQRHVIVISDGDPSPPPASLVQKYIDAKITITMVMVAGHGTPIHRRTMQSVANKTGGRFYNVTNPKDLPKIFIKEAQVVSRSLIQEGEAYQPMVVSRLPGPTEGFSSVPPVDGYVLTAPREGLAQVPIVIPTSEGNDPVYAYWNYGLGKSIAFTSDLTGRWGASWATWPEFRAFWEQSIRWVMRPSSPVNMLVNTRVEGDRAVVELEALDADASFLNFMDLHALVLRPDAEADVLSLQQVGPGRYRGEFPIDDAGAYLVNINYSAGDGDRQGNMQAAVSVPYSREFRATSHNRVLLEDLVERTHGRVLTTADPNLTNLFDKTDLEVPRSPRRVWDLLAIIAAALFVLDVAVRRVSIDPKKVADAAARAVGQRRDVSTDTVAAWKRTRSTVAHRASGATKRGVKFEADETSAKHAIDVGGEGTGAQTDRPAPVTRQSPTDQPDQTEDPEDYTSRLLQAKRRARGDDQDASGRSNND
jgi:uncharacterized membrane protein